MLFLEVELKLKKQFLHGEFWFRCIRTSSLKECDKGGCLEMNSVFGYFSVI